MVDATHRGDTPQQTEQLENQRVVDRTSESNLDSKATLATNQSRRTASIYRDLSGDPRGAAVWLNTTELAAIGVDVNDTDAVEICIVDGDLELVPAESEQKQ